MRSARVFQAVAVAGWLLGALAIAGIGPLALLAPGGLLLAGAGVLLLLDWRGVRGDLHEVQRKWPNHYPPAERVGYWRLYGAAIVLVGCAWAAAGVAAAT